VYNEDDDDVTAQQQRQQRQNVGYEAKRAAGKKHQRLFTAHELN